MRWFVAMLAVAACGGNEEGALLVVEAPDGATAERVEIILASADPATIEDVAHQRVQPSALTEEVARYYRQRAITGEVDNVGPLNGFAVRLEPDLEIPDGALIPILVGFDAQDQISAIGAVMVEGMPSPIEIPEDRVLQFTVEMSTMVQTDGVAGVGQGEVVSIECASFRSGIAWRPGDTQLRLLLPDRSNDRDATDASERARDLDCDGSVADEGDCDDLRAKFHLGAEEACDGQDFDCDFRQHELVPCNNLTTTCGATTGLAICDDTPGGTANPATCVAEPECACEAGQCAECLINFQQGDAAITACSPSLASRVVVADCDGGCTVEVLKRPGDQFKILIALPDSTAFTDKLTGVIDKIDIRALSFGPQVAAGNEIVGGIFLAIVRPGAAVQQVSFAIRLHEQATQCDPVTNTMSCSL